MQNKVISKTGIYTAVKQKGRSMLETIAVIAVSGLIVVSMLMMGNRVMDDRSSASVISEVSRVADGAKSLLAWYPNIDSINSTTLMKYLLCQGYTDSTVALSADDCNANLNTATTAKGKLSNGSNINATSAKQLLTNGNTCTTGTAGCHDVITIEVTNLRKSECIALAQTEWGKDFVGMSNASDNSIQYVASSATVFPLSLTDAVTFCGTKTEGTYSLKILFF